MIFGNQCSDHAVNDDFCWWLTTLWLTSWPAVLSTTAQWLSSSTMASSEPSVLRESSSGAASGEVRLCQQHNTNSCVTRPPIPAQTRRLPGTYSQAINSQVNACAEALCSTGADGALHPSCNVGGTNLSAPSRIHLATATTGPVTCFCTAVCSCCSTLRCPSITQASSRLM
eukprot:COSAG01_NODE_8831_length_2645_cov_5.119010_1_plen_171_part_00